MSGIPAAYHFQLPAIYFWGMTFKQKNAPGVCRSRAANGVKPIADCSRLTSDACQACLKEPYYNNGLWLRQLLPASCSNRTAAADWPARCKRWKWLEGNLCTPMFVFYGWATPLPPVEMNGCFVSFVTKITDHSRYIKFSTTLYFLVTFSWIMFC